MAVPPLFGDGLRRQRKATYESSLSLSPGRHWYVVGPNAFDGRRAALANRELTHEALTRYPIVQMCMQHEPGPIIGGMDGHDLDDLSVLQERIDGSCRLAAPTVIVMSVISARGADFGKTGAIVSQVDLPASFAALAGGQFPPAEAPDSMNLLPALLGESTQGREFVF